MKKPAFGGFFLVFSCFLRQVWYNKSYFIFCFPKGCFCMAKLTPDQIKEVKAQGFLLNRGTELFSGRIVAPGTVFSAQNFADMAELAGKFGNGKLICTSRLAVEIPGIPYDRI